MDTQTSWWFVRIGIWQIFFINHSLTNTFFLIVGCLVFYYLNGWIEDEKDDSQDLLVKITIG